MSLSNINTTFVKHLIAILIVTQANHNAHYICCSLNRRFIRQSNKKGVTEIFTSLAFSVILGGLNAIDL